MYNSIFWAHNRKVATTPGTLIGLCNYYLKVLQKKIMCQITTVSNSA